MKLKRFYICLLVSVLWRVFNCDAQTVTQVAAGQNWSLFIRSDGSLWGMGQNFCCGQMGLGTLDKTNRPVLIVSSNCTAAAGGAFHSLFLKSDGSLWGMGDNSDSQLGDGTIGNNRTSPEQIEESSVTALATGGNHSLFVKGGSLWVMGRNAYGQLGIGILGFNTTNFLPQLIFTGGVTAVAGGGAHSLFVKSDGSLWTMGKNQVGQLGDGNYLSGACCAGVILPERILTNGVFAVAAGENHSLFFKSDGSLWGMGDNTFGQLGAGTLTNSSLPIQIVASNVTAIAAGSSHSLFIKTDGSLWGMGASGSGALGTNANSTSPIQIVASGVTAIAAGSGHSLFVKSDGGLWAMGSNSQGQLGDGLSGGNHSYVPKLIVPGTGYHRISGGLLGGGTEMRLSFEGSAGTNYVLERTFSLSPANWVPLATNPAGAAGALIFTNTPDPGTNNFWRIHSAP